MKCQANFDATNTFIVCWCMEGLECIIPVDRDRYAISEYDQKVLNALTDSDEQLYQNQVGNIIRSLIVRCKSNHQRHYEMYTIATSFSQAEIENLFRTDPQVIADSIREKGQKIYSNRLEPESILIR